MEHWEDVRGYSGIYEVSNKGNIRNSNTEVVLKQTIDEDRKQCRVGLTKGGKRIAIDVNKIVALAFINHIPEGYRLIIKHIDGNNLNSNIENLQITFRKRSVHMDKDHVAKHRMESDVSFDEFLFS